ncbi:MAG: amidohydrolase, partial [Nonomuraea sp.]|nr:amidohydrolase [Nonomuraea sp.]
PSVDGHTTWANTEAMKRVGITRDSADPIGGEIVRDADGEPTGILREAAAYPLRDLMTSAELTEQLARAQENLLALGLTSVHDLDGEDCRAAYLRLKDAGRLKLRVHKAIPRVALEQAIAEGRRTGDGDDWFRTGPVKIFSDGALGSHTCHMSQPYAGGTHGIAVTPYEDLVRLFTLATDNGIAVATHAIGDQANHLVVDAYERIETPLRLRIEHAQHLRHDDIQRMARRGIVASMQPVHCTSDMDLVDDLLKNHDIASYAWRDMINSGVPLAFGSDAPVEDPNPFPALHAAVSRTRADGNPPGGWQPEQRLSMGEALKAHTLGSAYAAGEEARKGSLTPGRLADFIAVDTDPFAESPEAVQHTKVLTTVVGGEVRWQRQ